MVDPVLSQATEWGFVCSEDIQGNRLILPQYQNRAWKLQQAQDRWLLLLNNVPQVNLYPDEALMFLKRRLSGYQNSYNPATRSA